MSFWDYFAEKFRVTLLPTPDTTLGVDSSFPHVPSEKGYHHINTRTFERTFQELLKKREKDFRIVETGTSSNGVASTHMFDLFVTIFGGTVDTVDLNPATVERARQTVGSNTTCHLGDSLQILPTLRSEKPIDLLYLDSYDVEWLNPYPSAIHHLKEFVAIESQLRIGSLVLIDDTPLDDRWFDCDRNSELVQFFRQYNLPVVGKGTFVEYYLLKLGTYEKLLHEYQVLWKKVA